MKHSMIYEYAFHNHVGLEEENKQLKENYARICFELLPKSLILIKVRLDLYIRVLFSKLPMGRWFVSQQKQV